MKDATLIAADAAINVDGAQGTGASPAGQMLLRQEAEKMVPRIVGLMERFFGGNDRPVSNPSRR